MDIATIVHKPDVKGTCQGDTDHDDDFAEYNVEYFDLLHASPFELSN